jgi:hypothetical protein
MKRNALLMTIMSLGLAVPASVTAQSPEWTQKMDDCQDAKDDLQDAVGAKSGPKAAAAMTKITAILKETREFWAKQNMPDTVKLADNALAAAADMDKIAKSGKMDTAKAAFDKLNTACSSCHDTHPENKLKK